MVVNLKRLTDTATIPTAGTPYAAGYDLYADISESMRIIPHSTVKIGTGIAMEIPYGYAGFVFARSGLATKKGLRPGNCVGVIDCDYRGEVIVALHNDTNHIQVIGPQERVAQLVILRVSDVSFNEVDELSNTIRGTGGFGSTGTN